MPKAEWDEAADGDLWPPPWMDYDSGPCQHPTLEPALGGLVHAIEDAEKYWDREVYTMLCGRMLGHEDTIAVLHLPVNCLECLAEGA